MRPPDTRQSLIARLHDAGDAAAWVEFCAIYEATTFRIARKYGLQDADAREVTQEVLLIVSRKIHAFDLTRDGRFRGWLARITRNAAVDLFRRRKLMAVGGSDFARRISEVPCPGDQAEHDEFETEARRQQFRWAADQVRHLVNAKTWQAFWLSAVDGKPGEQVAKQLGMSVGAVYVARCRTLAYLPFHNLNTLKDSSCQHLPSQPPKHQQSFRDGDHDASGYTRPSDLLASPQLDLASFNPTGDCEQNK